MIITHKIKMDLTHKGIAPNIHMVQGDYCSRNIQLQLFSEHTPWHIPKNAIALIRYCRPDHSVGAYDTLPDGSCAYIISGNTVTIGIAPDALAIAGTVSLVVTLADAEQELTTFMLLLEVQPNLTSGPIACGDYASITGMVQTPAQAEVGQALVVAAVNEYGKPTLWETTVLPEIPEDHVPLDGSKEMTGNLKAPGLQISGNTVGDPPPCVQLFYDGTQIGSISADPDTHQLLLTQVTTDTSMAEVYKTPAPASGITEAKQYELLTTRYAVSLSQGGTGAATAEDARKNLGAASQADMLNMENRLLKAESMDCSVISSAASEVITVNDASNYRLEGLTLYGKTTQDGTPTPDAPVELVSVGRDGSIGVTVAGGQLLKPNKLVRREYGLTWECIDDLWHVYGTVESAYPRVVLDTPMVFEAGEYTISTAFVNGDFSSVSGRVALYDNVAEYFDTISSSPVKTRRFSEKTTFTRLIFGAVPVGTEVDVRFYVMVNAGNVALPYEVYKDKQALALSTPNGLPGIPVSSGGNYTDANGQQWISDEIDFAKGVYVQRIGQIDSYANEEIASEYMSTTGELSEGATVLYALDELTETPLSAEDIAAFKALHTNKPNTTVYTDSNAGIKLDYVADTKTYIDNKFAELAAIVANA